MGSSTSCNIMLLHFHITVMLLSSCSFFKIEIPNYRLVHHKRKCSELNSRMFFLSLFSSSFHHKYNFYFLLQFPCISNCKLSNYLATVLKIMILSCILYTIRGRVVMVYILTFQSSLLFSERISNVLCSGSFVYEALLLNVQHRRHTPYRT